jgi:adenosylcobinamide kinase/adenosylcobinamide-phosphate guanylyltransferase
MPCSLAEGMGDRRVFVATCVPHDDEMQADRVDRHRRSATTTWNTLEVPVDLADAITTHSPAADVMLVDCLTLWLSNLLMETQDVSRSGGRSTAWPRP